jgi:penicillin V acylase-like amidase (Ntn superfamily)
MSYILNKGNDMKNLFFTAIFLVTIINFELISCSCFSLHTSDQIVFGRKHDYYNPYGVIIYNPKNQLKVGVPLPGEHIVGWKSIYSSITISSIGVGFANSGMNEKGLALGHMGLVETIYPKQDDKPIILPSQWIQYMLDKCANTNEVIQEANKIRITDKMGGKEHYYVCDREGNVAIIEFLKGQMVVYTNKHMPYMLLCNETYEKSMNDIKQYKGLGGDKTVLDKVSILGENAVAEAMAIGCSKIKQFYKNESKNIIQDAFDIHYAMRFPVDTPHYQICETQYATVFDITNLKLYFRTKSNPAIREINFKDFEDNCSTKAKLLDIQTSSEGIVNKSFVDYSMQENNKCIYKFYEKESNKIPKEEMEFLSFYPEMFQCEK